MTCSVPIGGLRRCGTGRGADKGYDTADFVDQVRAIEMTPHVAQNDSRRGGSAIDARTTRHAGNAMSQHVRPRIEFTFVWLKTILAPFTAPCRLNDEYSRGKVTVQGDRDDAHRAVVRRWQLMMTLSQSISVYLFCTCWVGFTHIWRI